MSSLVLEMDACVQHDTQSEDTNWAQFFSSSAFEHIKPWAAREKKHLGISAAFCLACFVGTLIVCAFMCMRHESTTQPPCAQAVARRCDSGWSEHEGHCYKLLAHKSFYEANHECRHDYEGELASVHSKNQSDFVGGLASKNLHAEHIGAWIGLEREKGNDSKWAWTDGTPHDFENWSTDEDEDRPDSVDTNEHWCVLVVNGHYDDHTQWIIRSCGRDGETAICQKELSSHL